MAIQNNITDGYYNFIEIYNSEAGVAINCEIVITIRFVDNNESRENRYFLSMIDKEERLFIPTDLIPNTRSYIITHIEIRYESMMQEEMMISRIYEVINDRRIIRDLYLIKYTKDEDYREMFEVRGSDVEWMRINRN